MPWASTRSAPTFFENTTKQQVGTKTIYSATSPAHRTVCTLSHPTQCQRPRSRDAFHIALLDFTVPKGLQFSISKAPNPQFRTTYSLNALPSLNGSIGYIFSTCELDLKNSGDVRFKDVVERFKVFGPPKKPEGKEEEWLAGHRVDTRGKSS